MNLNRNLLLFLFLFSNILLFSQKEVIIKGKNEIIYPFEINDKLLYFNWTKNNPNFENIIVYAMGEATHGTKEFFDIKVKSFEYLVTHHNYRVFGIEASYGECNYINDYIQTGIGNIDTVMNYFAFWTWKTEEVKELILWMKNYNQKNKVKVVFYGFDMQESHISLKYLSDFFKKDTSSYVKAFNEIVEPVISKNDYKIRMLIKENSIFQDTLLIIEKELYKWREKYKTNLVKTYSLYKFKQLEYNIITYKQGIERYKKNYNYRDSCMAINVIEIQKIENNRMFIWAHNGHINKTATSYDIKWMGEHLSEILNNKYYSVGFVFSKGSFQSYVPNKNKYEFKVTTLPKYRKNTFTKPLDEINEEMFFINIQDSKNSFFKKNLKTYRIGAVFYKKKFSSTKINAEKQFDGIIYLSNTSRAEPVKDTKTKPNKQ